MMNHLPQYRTATFCGDLNNAYSGLFQGMEYPVLGIVTKKDGEQYIMFVLNEKILHTKYIAKDWHHWT